MKFISILLISFIIILFISNIAYVQIVNQNDKKMIITFAWDYDPNIVVDNFYIYSRIQKGSYNRNNPSYIIDGNLRTYTTSEQPLENLWFVCAAKLGDIISEYSNEVTNSPLPPYNFDMTIEYLIRFK